MIGAVNAVNQNGIILSVDTIAIALEAMLAFYRFSVLELVAPHYLIR